MREVKRRLFWWRIGVVRAIVEGLERERESEEREEEDEDGREKGRIRRDSPSIY